MDFLRQSTRVAGGGRVPVRTKGKGVDLLASQLVSVGHVLRRLDHLDVGVASQQ
jgi:hypothetical protein